MSLHADAPPEIIVTARWCSPRIDASIFMTAAFALPLSAGARTRTFRLSPSQPEISSLEVPGTTFRDNFTAGKGGIGVVSGTEASQVDFS